MCNNVTSEKGIIPKRGGQCLFSQNSWYSYYAGYSDFFVEEYLKKYQTGDFDFCVLDPWNGSGTTTLCSSISGIKSIGYDINPAMYTIALGKTFDIRSVKKEEWENRIEQIKDRFFKVHYSDPLFEWFSLSTVRSIRKFETIIKTFKGETEKFELSSFKDRITQISEQSAYLYLCLFIIVRKKSESLHSSNPTWVKRPGKKKIFFSFDELCRLFIELTESHRSNTFECVKKAPQLGIAVSQHLPLEDGSIDLIVSSPPYCTRIDYAIYTQIENAILGYSDDEIKKLRSLMIGSPTVHNASQQVKLNLNAHYCNSVLNDIGTHDSKAALTYYYKTYKQYFVEMAESMTEIYRVLKKGGKAVLVVQDSWFKDIHVDVPRAISELGELLGLYADRIDYDVKNNIAFINSKSRKYSNKKRAVESVLIFEKRA